MERLRFTHFVKLGSCPIKTYKGGSKELEHDFLGAYGQAVFKFKLTIRYFDDEEGTASEMQLYAETNPGRVQPKDVFCKFIVKRTDHSDLKYSAIGREFFIREHGKDCEIIPVFKIPDDHEFLKLLCSFFKNHGGISPVLELVLELPKKPFFTKNWPKQLDDPPIGWENDERYKVLTVEDKHNLHIICTDGVFYAKKRHLIRKSEYFKEKFENECKDKAEITLDFSLETMKFFAIFWQANTFIPPKTINPKAIGEILEHCFDLDRGNWNALESDLDVYLCGHSEIESLSLYDLISWWKVTTFMRMKDLIDWVIVKKYYDEIITEYKPDATFTDEAKTEIHRILHSQLNRQMESSKTPFERLGKVHSMIQNVVVTEIGPKN